MKSNNRTIYTIKTVWPWWPFFLYNLRCVFLYNFRFKWTMGGGGLKITQIGGLILWMAPNSNDYLLEIIITEINWQFFRSFKLTFPGMSLSKWMNYHNKIRKRDKFPEIPPHFPFIIKLSIIFPSFLKVVTIVCTFNVFRASHLTKSFKYPCAEIWVLMN